VNEYRSVLKRAGSTFAPLDLELESILRRRDRKRRNQRITAGAVGIAVFLPAVLIVTSLGSLDRTQTSVVPGGTGTGPAETGPAETGPAEPTTTPTPTPTTTDDAGWDGYGIPPEGTTLSSPVEGRPILEQSYEGEWLLGKKIVSCPTGCPEWYNTFLIVYADGRVLWWHNLRGPGEDGPSGGNFVMERRLTPEGVDLVRSGVRPGIAPDYGDLPDNAWADATARPYAPPLYAVCFRVNGVDDPSSHPLLAAVDLLPASATALLDGSDPDPLHPGCLVVSTENARAFSGILSDVGFDLPADLRGVTPGATVGSWLLRDAEPILGEPVGIYLHPLWPDGDWHWLCCA
jgi:hypothetical protein